MGEKKKNLLNTVPSIFSCINIPTYLTVTDILTEPLNTIPGQLPDKWIRHQLCRPAEPYSQVSC